MQGAHPIRILIQGLQSSCLYPGFTEFPFLSKVSKFPSLSRVYRVLVSIQGLQSSRLYPGFTEFQSLSRVHRVPISIFSLFLARGRGKKERKKPLLLCTIIFFFFQVGCTVMLFQTGFCSAARNWRELYKNLTFLSSLDAYT